MCKMYEIISELCNEKGISVSKMCKDVNISNSSLTELKAGRTKELSTKSALKIANYFDVSVNYLSGETTERKKHESVSNDDIKFALFGGDSEYISDESYEDVLAFAKIIAEKEKRKRAEMNELN